jgi:hypothetical protein
MPHAEIVALRDSRSGDWHIAACGRPEASAYFDEAEGQTHPLSALSSTSIQ